MDFSFSILLSTIFIVIGFLGLHNLMRVSLMGAFERSLMAGMAKLCRALLVRIGFLAYIIIGIIQIKWFMPFVYIVLALIIVTVVTRLLIVSRLISIHFISTHEPIGQLVYAAIAVFFLVRVIFFQFLG